MSLRGLNTSGRKVELVARAFVAFQLIMNIIGFSEEQKLKLERYYQEILSKHSLVDPMLMEKNKRINDMTRWPVTSLGNISDYILGEKMCYK